MDGGEEEFACPGALRGPLVSQRHAVERIFRVSFAVAGADGDAHAWVRLRGSARDASAAKIFVSGLVKPEEQRELAYPVGLQCVFCAAAGFFLDCMIRSTSAYIVVGSPGFLLVSGLAEPAVRAYSLVADLLDRYKGGRAQEQSFDELCSSPPAFKALVEKWEGHHILDLLLLPVSVKEALLDLVGESPWRSAPLPLSPKVRWHGLGPPGNAPPSPGDGAPDPRDEGPEKAGRRDGGPSAPDENFGHLLKFFTAMGYAQEVVKRVLGRTGPGEASRILDLVQREQDDVGEGGPPRRADDDTAGAGRGGLGDVPDEVAGWPDEEDFVLGVLKKAAVSCGYTEHRVAKACRKLPDASTHLLLLELQKEASAAAAEDRKAGRKAGRKAATIERDAAEDARPAERDTCDSQNANGNAKWLRAKDIHTPPVAPGPADGATFPPPLPIAPPSPGRRYPAPRAQRSGESGDAMVTGRQRFLEGLQTPFELQLTDRAGDPQLRTVILDGSNVAMSHGLGHFFSCRGIALAVGHFWGRGHRQISALLPQWRQKSHPRVTERHYLDELQKLGLLSYTPSREVSGTRMASYDDRFMLQLAERTGGVIVTNDNMRDLLDQSPPWRDIIKKRLLQYTFVGDHFMIPDDPLGRGGPHLDDFLRWGHRVPDRSEPTPDGARDGACHRPGVERGPLRTSQATAGPRESLRQVFPGRDDAVLTLLRAHPKEDDLDVLSALLLE